MNEIVKVTVYRRDNQYWVIPSEKYNGIILNRHTFDRMDIYSWWPTIDNNFARLNATPCTHIESLYVLRKFYQNYPGLQVSLVLE